MADTKISALTVQATIASAHMSGVDGTPTNKKFPGYAFWGEKGADVASAGTLVLGDDGNFFHITGTTTITDIDFTTAKDGRMAVLEFDGALTLTHNGTTLNLPGGKDIVTAAGDRATIVQDSGDNIHVVAYQRAAGVPSGGVNLGTAVASTSGASIDFTGIPAWVRKITLSLVGVSTNGTSNIILQIGDSGGIETTGYLGAGSFAGTTVGTANYTTGIGINMGLAAGVLHGSFTLTLVDPANNTWAVSNAFGTSNAANTFWGGGSKSTSAVLDRVRLTTVGGTDTFDAGVVNISYQ